jgi:hypothetical protein
MTEHYLSRLPAGSADEVADVLIYLVRFADVCGIDVLSEVHAKMKRNETPIPSPASAALWR